MMQGNIEQIEQLYNKADIKSLINWHLFRSSFSSWSFFECVHSDESARTLLRIIFGDQLLEKLDIEEGVACQTVSDYVMNIKAVMKDILDKNMMSMLDNSLDGKYYATNVVDSFYMVMFKRIVKCFDFKYPMLDEFGRVFREVFVFRRDIYSPIISVDRFRVAYENLSRSKFCETLGKNNKYTDLILARIAWFLFKLAIDLIRVTIHVEPFANHISIAPLRFEGSNKFEQLKPFQIHTVLLTCTFKLREIEDEGETNENLYEPLDGMASWRTRSSGLFGDVSNQEPIWNTRVMLEPINPFKPPKSDRPAFRF